MKSTEIDYLVQLSRQFMLEKGLDPDFSKEALDQLSQIKSSALHFSVSVDLRSLVWCSIDNDNSRDLDQLTYAEKHNGKIVIWVAIADVDALVQKSSAIDVCAQKNTTSVYTPVKVFPMLPEKLSTNFTSLNENEDRNALVVKMVVNEVGDIEDSSIFQSIVRNYAKLTYNSIGGWLQGSGSVPEKVEKVIGLEKSILCQHEIAQRLKQRRHDLGALILEPSQVEVKFTHNNDLVLDEYHHNFAHQLIEEFMIGANSEIAKHFKAAHIASLRRAVRKPYNWKRIVEIAQKLGETLPEEPQYLALSAFLKKRKEIDPTGFPELSLTVIKLLGKGEYIVEIEGDEAIGHFGLALAEYTHATAPNRRFPDLIALRQCKSFLRKEKVPYTVEELQALAFHCTQQEDAASKVERQSIKSAAAKILAPQIGSVFNGIITGASEKGTWIRISNPSVEGKIIKGFETLKVGDKASVKLVLVDIPKGFIDFHFLDRHNH